MSSLFVALHPPFFLKVFSSLKVFLISYQLPMQQPSSTSTSTPIISLLHQYTHSLHFIYIIIYYIKQIYIPPHNIYSNILTTYYQYTYILYPYIQYT